MERIPYLLIGFLLAVVALIFFATQTISFAQEQTLDDSSIENAVAMELVIDEAIDAEAIDVSVEEGIVTLSGTIDTILEKDRATQLAETVKGVRGVVNDIEVSVPERSDNAIAEDVRTALDNDPVTEIYQLNVSLRDGTVVLTGTVESWQEAQIAANVVKSVKGVEEVVNNISWDVPLGERADSEIEREIERKLDNNVWVDDGLIEVEVNDGNVEISGSVGSAAEKRRAYDLAWVAGVQAVSHEDLEVRWWARDRMQRKEKYTEKSDQTIKQAVNDAFLYDPRVRSFNVEVGVEDGVVTLTGTVNNLQAKNSAANTASNVVGVQRVQNQIKVRPRHGVADSEIADTVIKGLKANAVVDRFDLTVHVSNGIVHLYGQVDNQFEKNEAARVAETQPGVLGVRNQIEIQGQWDWKPDWQIQEEVKDQLFWSPFVDEDDVEVAVTAGEVTLTGTVSTPSERRAATENAYEGGARRVVNKLTVDYGTPMYRGTPYYGPVYPYGPAYPGYAYTPYYQEGMPMNRPGRPQQQ